MTQSPMLAELTADPSIAEMVSWICWSNVIMVMLTPTLPMLADPGVAFHSVVMELLMLGEERSATELLDVDLIANSCAVMVD